MTAETGYAAWTFSRTGKLNAWAWHGLGAADKVHGWACVGSTIYLRKEGDQTLYLTKPNQYLAPTATSVDSTSVVATTQWLDFGQIGKGKTLTGIDADVKNVTAIEIYISVGGDRTGVPVDTIPIGSNDGGWTYNGEIIPLEIAATEFKLRLVGDGKAEVQINRLTLYYEPLEG